MNYNAKTPPPCKITNCVTTRNSVIPLLDSGIQSIINMDPLGEDNIWPEENNLNKVAAFTLVEMSIVLIIIGLIVAGIAKGQEMIHSAKVRNVISEFQKYQVALNTFDLKYDALPGDLSNATDYWPGVTVSGNGNGRWDNPILEGLRAWEQLSLAGMVDDTYDMDGGFSQYETGITLPESPFGTRWHFGTGTITYYGNVLLNGNYIQLANGDNNSSGLGGIGSVDASVIDKKLDDGKALTGKILGYRNGGSDCINRNNPNTDYYKDRNYTNGCAMFFKLY